MRLTQLPKTQALEFLLVSPLRPKRLFLAEAIVGLSRLGLVTLAGLPPLLYLVLEGLLLPEDLLPLVVMPFTWGALTGLGLVAWSYENIAIRRWGERILMLLVLVYLVVGVLAAENLPVWLAGLPDGWDYRLLLCIRAMHEYSPFTVSYEALMAPVDMVWPRLFVVELIALACTGLLLWRAASRLQGHFQDRHYLPVEDVSRQRRTAVGDRPLSWWAVKRVSEFSGRVNLWLAGGFAVLYSAYTVAGHHWPDWLGQQVFVVFDGFGGVPVLATALVVLAAVPAAFQYGLWDSNEQDRCRRLELLLLTDLDAIDYWNAGAAAAWQRGRGYFAVRADVVGGTRGVGKGKPWTGGGRGGVRGSAVGTAFGAGIPGLCPRDAGEQAGNDPHVGAADIGVLAIQSWASGAGGIGPAGQHLPADDKGTALSWLPGPLLAAAVTLVVGRRTLRYCDADLRRWYSQNRGSKS